MREVAAESLAEGRATLDVAREVSPFGHETEVVRLTPTKTDSCPIVVDVDYAGAEIVVDGWTWEIWQLDHSERLSEIRATVTAVVNGDVENRVEVRSGRKTLVTTFETPLGRRQHTRHTGERNGRPGVTRYAPY